MSDGLKPLQSKFTQISFADWPFFLSKRICCSTSRCRDPLEDVICRESPLPDSVGVLVAPHPESSATTPWRVFGTSGENITLSSAFVQRSRISTCFSADLVASISPHARDLDDSTVEVDGGWAIDERVIAGQSASVYTTRNRLLEPRRRGLWDRCLIHVGTARAAE